MCVRGALPLCSPPQPQPQSSSSSSGQRSRRRMCDSTTRAVFAHSSPCLTRVPVQVARSDRAAAMASTATQQADASDASRAAAAAGRVEGGSTEVASGMTDASTAAATAAAATLLAPLLSLPLRTLDAAVCSAIRAVRPQLTQLQLQHNGERTLACEPIAQCCAPSCTCSLQAPASLLLRRSELRASSITPDLGSFLPHLTSINLAHNRLDAIPQLRNLPHLTQLDLQANQM